jgi:hypothetical protein
MLANALGYWLDLGIEEGGCIKTGELAVRIGLEVVNGDPKTDILEWEHVHVRGEVREMPTHGMAPLSHQIRQRYSLPSLRGLDTTLAALNIGNETIREAGRALSLLLYIDPARSFRSFEALQKVCH